MINHLIFNKLKWFNVADNADSTTINGKNYEAVPEQITIKPGTDIYYAKSDGVFDDRTSNSLTISVSGRAKMEVNGTISDYYVSVDNYARDNRWFTFVPVAGCIPKWGG